MRVMVCDSYEEMTIRATRIVAGQVYLKPNCVLGLATGSTPVGMYEKLGEMCKNEELDFSEVKTFNLDEYYPIKASNRQSYRYFMDEKLFSKINIKPENTHIPNGESENPERECGEYENAINLAGGIDLQVLGIGRNGHIGFNEPGEHLDAYTHLTDLTANTIEANSRFFSNDEIIPTKALTMGISTILNAKKIILLANGEAKADVVAELMNKDINTSNPASMLKTHPDVVLICDRAAFSKAKLNADK